MSRLLQILLMLYRWDETDVERITNDLIAARKRAWFTALTNEARACRYTGPVNPPRFQDLDWVKRESRLDAESIVRTYNRDVERYLNQLYARQPKYNRHHYAFHMAKLLADRNSWKSRQIATQTEYTTVGYVKQRFTEENGLRGSPFIFSGPPPVCGECMGHFAKGVVNQAYVDQHPTPIHIGCPHTWKRLPGVYCPPPDELWVG